MAQLASDNFNRANAASLGANWATLTGTTTLNVNGNAARASVDPSGNRYSAISWPNDQYSQVTLADPVVDNTGEGFGGGIRYSSVAGTGYFCLGNNSGIDLYIVVAGVFTSLGHDATVPVIGDVMYIEAQGTAIKVKQNGTTRLSVTDATIASGSAGLFGAFSSAAPKGDDWSGGDFSGSFPPVPGEYPYSARYDLARQ